MIGFNIILHVLVGDQGSQVLGEIASDNGINLFGIQNVDEVAEAKDFEEPEESQEIEVLVDVS